MTALPALDRSEMRATLRAALTTLSGRLLILTSTPQEIHHLAATAHELHVRLGEPDYMLALHVQQVLRINDLDMVDRGFYALHLAQAADRL